MVECSSCCEKTLVLLLVIFLHAAPTSIKKLSLLRLPTQYCTKYTWDWNIAFIPFWSLQFTRWHVWALIFPLISFLCSYISWRNAVLSPEVQRRWLLIWKRNRMLGSNWWLGSRLSLFIPSFLLLNKTWPDKDETSIYPSGHLSSAIQEIQVSFPEFIFFIVALQTSYASLQKI